TGGILPVLEVVVDQHIAMNSIHGKHDHHEKIGEHDGRIERIGLVQAVEGWINELVPKGAGGIAALQDPGDSGVLQHQNMHALNASSLWAAGRAHHYTKVCDPVNALWSRWSRSVTLSGYGHTGRTH